VERQEVSLAEQGPLLRIRVILLLRRHAGAVLGAGHLEVGEEEQIVRTEKGFTSKGQQHRKKRRVGSTEEGTFAGVVVTGGRSRGRPCYVPHGLDSRGG
jgi:hypothetical protein